VPDWVIHRTFETQANSGRAALIEAADKHARGLMPILRFLRAEGMISIGAVTRSLNERKTPTA
jgi:hypothetical protein